MDRMKQKLTTVQEDVLNRLNNNVRCLFMSGVDAYWFMVDDHKKVTKQIHVLEEKGFIKVKYTGISDRSIVIIKHSVKEGEAAQ